LDVDKIHHSEDCLNHDSQKYKHPFVHLPKSVIKRLAQGIDLLDFQKIPYQNTAKYFGLKTFLKCRLA